MYDTSQGALPSYYQYGSDHASSGDELSDYCPRLANYVLDNVDSYCTWIEDKPNTAVDKGENYCDTCRCFMSTLAADASQGTDVNPGCYKQFCAGPAQLKIIINSIYYPCPAGSTLVAENFGGELTCPSNDNLCAFVPYIPDWPEFTSISPDSGTPGTAVTIKGTNFVAGMAVTIGAKDVGDLVFVDSNTYTCTVSSEVDVANLVSKKVFVILKDQQGRTAVGSQVFDLQVDASTVLAKVGEWVVANPVWSALIVIAFVLIIGLGIFLCFREYKKARYGKASGGEEDHKHKTGEPLEEDNI